MLQNMGWLRSKEFASGTDLTGPKGLHKRVVESIALQLAVLASDSILIWI